MFDIKRLVSIATIVLGFCSFNVLAEPVHGCGIGCSNVDNKAKGVSMRYDQDDIFTVIDFNTDTAHTYKADKYFKYGEMWDRAIKVSTTSNAMAIINDIKDVRVAAKNLIISVPPNLPNTPNYDGYNSATVLLTDPQSRDHIARYLKDNANLIAQISTLLSELVADVGEVVNVKLDVRVRATFDDFSTGDFLGINEVINGQLSRNYEFIPDTARFADGSRMPRSLENIVGNWAFNYEGDADGFIRLGALWGVQVREAVTCRPTKEFECRTDSEGNVTCTTTQKCP